MDALVSSLRELAAKATKAPWRLYGGLWIEAPESMLDRGRDTVAEPIGSVMDCRDVPSERKNANAALIVALRNSLDALLSRIEAADAMEEAVKKANDWTDIDHALAAYSAAKGGAPDA